MILIGKSEVHALIERAEAAAGRLRRRLRLPHQETEDFRQDLLTDLVARLPAYDPCRGSIGAFSGVILQHRAARIAKRVRRERQFFGEEPLSLDEPLPTADGTRGDLIPESEGYGAWLGQQSKHQDLAELRLSLVAAVSALDGEDRRLCIALTADTVDELAEPDFGARSSLYRQLARIRLDLLARGVGRVASTGGA